MDVEGEWMRGNCGVTFGYTGRMLERELWSESWIYRASGREGFVQ